jgi:hypothetical protein
MDDTILGKRKDKSGIITKPSPPPLTSAVSAMDSTKATESDGLEHLDQPPPNLTGIDGTAFTVASLVDLQSPLLLDVLSDKAQVPQQTSNTLCSRQPLFEGTKVIPKESEWNEW